jgi:hypothetical protein
VVNISAGSLQALRPRVTSFGFLAVVAVAPLVLLLARLLPAQGFGLGLRVLAATACVLIVPGALVVRALGWPERIGVAVAASLAWSSLLLAVALAATFLVHGSLRLTLALLACATLAALLPAAAARAPVLPERSDGLAALGVLVMGAFVGLGAWAGATDVLGDALFHLARVRKLDELGELSSLEAVGEFRDGGLHPGYAFPVWHSVLALVAQLGGVDTLSVVLYGAAVLAPLALLLAYAAGSAVFGSWPGGVATALAVVGLAVLGRRSVGALHYLAEPPQAALYLLVPAVVALFFAYVSTARTALLLSLGAAAFALAVVHPTYVLFLALPLVAFLAARVVLGGEGREARRAAVALGAVLLPSGLFLAWLWPVVADTAAHTPTAAEEAAELRHHARELDVSGDTFRYDPGLIGRGPAAVAALLAVPGALLAARRRWAAYVLGGSFLVLAVLLARPLFTALADAASLSQALRLRAFLPLAVALAGGALLLGRLKAAGLAAALAAGLALQLAYPFEEGEGPAWPVWLALAGAACALVAGRFLRVGWEEARSWGAAATAAFLLPLAVDAAKDFQSAPPDPIRLTRGLVESVRRETAPADVLLAQPWFAYRLVAQAPIHVVAVPEAHAVDSEESRLTERLRDTAMFFRPQTSETVRREILTEYGVSWIVVERERRYAADVSGLERVYEDRRFALFRVNARG